MSGPKIVRVVTREERIETCDRLLAQFDIAVRGLNADSARLGDAEGAELAASSARRDALLELIRQDAFDQAERQSAAKSWSARLLPRLWRVGNLANSVTPRQLS